jgi:arylsulfatase A-like enzyme
LRYHRLLPAAVVLPLVGRLVTGGRRVAVPVQPPDIMPTLLDLAGVAAPSGLHGHSLVPLLRDEPREWPRRAAFSGTDLTRGEGKNGPKVTVTDVEWSLLLAAVGHEAPALYHRPADPQQQQNVVADHPDVAEALHADLLAFLRRVGSPAGTRLDTLGEESDGLGRGQDAPNYRWAAKVGHRAIHIMAGRGFRCSLSGRTEARSRVSWS